MPTMIWSSSIRTTKAAIDRKRRKMLELSPNAGYSDDDVVQAMLLERELARQEAQARLRYPLPGMLFLCRKLEYGNPPSFCKPVGNDLSDVLSDLPYDKDIDVMAAGWDVVARSDLFRGRLLFRILKPDLPENALSALLERVGAYGLTDSLLKRYTVSVLPYAHAAIGCPCPDSLRIAAGNPEPGRKGADAG